MSMNQKQIRRDLIEGLHEILKNKKSRLWLVDFVRNQGGLLSHADDVDVAMHLDGRRAFVRAFVEDLSACDIQPNVRAGIYMDVIEGTYERAYQTQGAKTDE